jgi:hypothetical protein
MVAPPPPPLENSKTGSNVAREFMGDGEDERRREREVDEI